MLTAEMPAGPVLLQKLRNMGLFLENDHFVYSSGRHGSCYVDSDGIVRDAPLLELCGQEIASRCRSSGIEAVVGVAAGGNPLAMRAASALRELAGRAVAAVMTGKSADGGIDIVYDDIQDLRGRRTLVVDDVLTTGGSVRKTVMSAERAGAHVVAAFVIVNRGADAPSAGVPFLGELLRLELPSWAADECPACRTGRPVNSSFGHGRAFLERRGRP